MKDTTELVQHSTQHISAGVLMEEITQAYTMLEEHNICKRLFLKDATLWGTEPEQVKAINNRLGWLHLPDNFEPVMKEITAFVEQIKEEGYEYAVLLGMGGSSLCSEVAHKTFDTANGYLQLLVLDNTSPEAIKALEAQIDLEKTLFIVASKSGGTKETISFFKYFYQQLETKTKSNPGNNFIAITDAGTPLVKLAKDYKFRKVFSTPTDIGGRYSVLSTFGILPMALMGIDVNALMESAKQMKDSCGTLLPADVNPGLSLGVALGIFQKHGRDKITFVLSSSISSLGLWLEQLIAESTGKEGKGLIPIAGEKIGKPEAYDNDRVFVHIHLASDDNEADTKKIVALEAAGHPVVSITVPDETSLGGEYYRWEVATAIAGMEMNLNPFDEPNVAESKENTENILDDWQRKNAFEKNPPLAKFGDITIYSSTLATKAVADQASIKSILFHFASQAKPHDYIALLPYFLMTETREKILQTWRQDWRNNLKIAVTVGIGPRYLHSTGQLHKGGPATGLYIIFIGENEEDLLIPDEKYGFGVLHQAQALGDFRSLDEKGRSVLYIVLGKKIDEALIKLEHEFVL